MKTHRFMMTAIAVFCFMGNMVPAAAQEIVFGNGIGTDITQLTIRPSKAQYPKDRNAFSIAVQFNNQSDASIELPEHFRKYETFDIDVSTQTTNYFAKKGVPLDFNKGTPLLELSEAGKESTFPIISALAGGVGSVLFLTSTRAGKIMFFDLTRDAWDWFRKPKFGKARLLLLIPPAIMAGSYIAGNAIAAKYLDIQVAYIQ